MEAFPTGRFVAVVTVAMAALLCERHHPLAVTLPLDPQIMKEVKQPPSITRQSPVDYIVDPRDNIVVECEGQGNPTPKFQWRKDGRRFDPDDDPYVSWHEGSGTITIDMVAAGIAEAYEGIYQCSAENEGGTALSENITVRLSRAPLWPRENLEPVVAMEGSSAVLPCNPPDGLPPPIIFWMDGSMERVPQDSRVSQGLNGNLYFANVLPTDGKDDYVCYARFTHTQTIQQKQPLKLIVRPMDADNDTASQPGHERPSRSRPAFLEPAGTTSSKLVLRGDTLLLECIAQGLPTPELQWSKLGGEITRDRVTFDNFNKTLSIRDASEADSGSYQCRATNSEGKALHTVTVTVEAKPYWIPPVPESRVYSPRDNAQLVCRAHGTPKPRIRWLINGAPIDESPADPGRRVDGDTVMLNDLDVGGSAVYQCEASNRHGTILANAYVSVLAVPPRMLTEPDRLYMTREKQVVYIECKVFASPRPNILWFKGVEGSQLQGTRYRTFENGTLRITDVRRTDAGTYTCVASNDLRSNQVQARLSVKEATQISGLPKMLSARKGSDVRLECIVRHDPSLEVTVLWRRNGAVLPYESRYRVNGSILVIASVREADEARFVCTATTGTDSDSAGTSLRVLDRPDAPTDLRLSERQDRSVHLAWAKGSSHNSPITEFLVEFEDERFDPGTWKELTRVSGNRSSAELRLSPYMDYRFRVTAANEVGESPPSVPSESHTTGPAAPDMNPTGVKGEGTQPSNMIISWTPLSGADSNGPGLHYLVGWRVRDAGGDGDAGGAWTDTLVTEAARYVVQPTPTFTAYELRVRAVNDAGEAPEPRVVIGYSGEDSPLEAPGRVDVEVLNSTFVRVSWEPVTEASVRGHLKGYKVFYWKVRELLGHPTQEQQRRRRRRRRSDRRFLVFAPDRRHGVVPGLEPFCSYELDVRVSNGRSDGPPSPARSFQTPEGVPSKPEFLRIQSITFNSATLVWAPPLQPHGVITGYVLHYQSVNGSGPELGPPARVELARPNVTSHTLDGLRRNTRYRFGVSARTRAGEGGAADEEGSTDLDVAEVASAQLTIATEGWFIGIMCAVALLVLVLLFVCFVRRSKGGKYPVKERECAYPDPENQQMRENIFAECRIRRRDNENKPLQGGSSGSSDSVRSGGRHGAGDGDADTQVPFNEDGSFIGKYATATETAAAAATTAVAANGGGGAGGGGRRENGHARTRRGSEADDAC
ncbi:neuronal cell adhesion molecule-like isoform X6 [Petromyzon marinus]|uniref:neuronal cell adhesion molecule-like isoform X6 n=1 Tax=Petromyzon marinus TaxID=7757 RepID=UPI003F701461